MKIYQIAEGPIQACEVEGHDDNDLNWVVFALVEQPDGSLLEEEVNFSTYANAISLVNHFKEQIIPYSITLDELYD
jgi:hypothetical protein